jgi:nucleoid-associated protein YgaU
MELKDYLKAIKMNESKISTIVGGLIILVIGIMVFNYFRNLNSGITTPTSVNTESTPVTQTTYLVKQGDTLWDIAQSELGDGFRWQEIAEANDITNGSINTGQELIIPTNDVTSEATDLALVTPSSVELETPVAIAQPTIAATVRPTTLATPKATVTTEDDSMSEATTITTDNYTVVAGDNLWKIAERAYGDGARWKEIAEANDLDNPSIIHAGNVFSLPR